MKVKYTKIDSSIIDVEKPALCDISYLNHDFSDPPHPFSLYSTLSMNYSNLSKLFLADDLLKVGAKDSPSEIVPDIHQKQKIAGLSLRLSPPIKLRSLRDVRDLLLNHELLRLVYIGIWLIICGLIETFMAQLSDMRYFRGPPSGKHALSDLLHDAFPRVENTQIVNYILTTILVYTLAGFAFQSPDWTTRFTLLRRFAFIMGILYVFRGITLLVTTLPSSLVDECRPPEIELTGTVGERFGFLLSVVGGTAMTCTDNIFSGHTSMMMSCAMLWRAHSRLRRPFSWFLYLLVTAGILLILFTRFHYSIDVVLAIYITYTIWNIYLSYVQEAAMYYMFGFTGHSTMDIFKHHIKSADAISFYEYLVWQPHPLGKKWLMWICMYVDGLDIRLRNLGIFDKEGVWKSPMESKNEDEKNVIAPHYVV